LSSSFGGEIVEIKIQMLERGGRSNDRGRDCWMEKKRGGLKRKREKSTSSGEGKDHIHPAVEEGGMRKSR